MTLGNRRITYFLVLLISLLAGIVSFVMTGVKPVVLVLEIVSLKSCQGGVIANEAGNGKLHRLQYDVFDGSGVSRTYVVELPPRIFKDLTILPVNPENGYSLKQVKLSNDSVWYSWDEKGLCTQRSEGHSDWDACNGSFPQLASAKDSGIVISGIPDHYFETSLLARSAMAVFVSLMSCLALVWLTYSPAGYSFRGSFQVMAARIMWIAFSIMFIYQFSVIIKYAVDAPYLDEWIYFTPDALAQGLTWKWVTEFYVNHRIIPTKLLAWANLKLFNLNFAGAIIFNYILFGGLLLAIIKLKIKMLGKQQFRFFPAFMFFLLSPIAYQNHMWGFTSQFHLVLLFFIIALIYAFPGKITINSTIAFVAFAVLAMYSFSAGVIVAVVCLACRSLFLTRSIISGEIEKNTGYLAIAVSVFIIGIALLIWFQGFSLQPAAWSQKPVFPDDPRFWNYFFNLVSLGFGFMAESVSAGIACLILVVFPVIMLIITRKSRWLPSTWMMLAAILSVLAVLATISMGRSTLIESKIPRYAEVAFLLIPFTAISWWLALEREWLKHSVLTILWLSCMISYSDDWSTKIYKEFRQTGLETLMCAEHYYADGKEEPACIDIPYSYLEQARKIKARFTQSMHAR